MSKPVEAMMTEENLSAAVRKASPYANVIDIQGEINSFSEPVLTKAYTQASEGGVRTIIFNFSGLEYMNSMGMGMLITLIIRARKENKNIGAYGLNDHYRHVFALTRLDQVLPLYESETVALAKADRMDLPEREY